MRLQRTEPDHRADHRHGRGPGGAVEPAGRQRGHRSGQGRRAGQGLRRRGAGGEEPRRAVAAGHRRVRTILGDIQKATTAAVHGHRAGQQGGRGGRPADRAARRIDPGACRAACPKPRRPPRRSPRRASSSWSAWTRWPCAMESIKQASTQNVASATPARDRGAQSQRPRPTAQADGRAATAVS